LAKKRNNHSYLKPTSVTMYRPGSMQLEGDSEKIVMEMVNNFFSLAKEKLIKFQFEKNRDQDEEAVSEKEKYGRCKYG
jgi:hypothetical protein